MAEASLMPDPCLNICQRRVNTFHASEDTPTSMLGLVSFGPSEGARLKLGAGAAWLNAWLYKIAQATAYFILFFFLFLSLYLSS